MEGIEKAVGYNTSVLRKWKTRERRIKELTERKRNVILLSYFMEMSDADIAREMNLVRSTIHEHRTRSLEILRKIMEGIADEKDV